MPTLRPFQDYEESDILKTGVLWQDKLPDIACQKVREGEEAFLPEKREEDSDYDLFASQDILCRAQDLTEVPTNLAIEYPEGYEGKVEDKSGWARKKFTIFGGVIDGGYTGEHVIFFFNANKQDVLIKKGQKVAQLAIRKKEKHRNFAWTTREFRKTERGDGRCGSTGLGFSDSPNTCNTI